MSRTCLSAILAALLLATVTVPAVAAGPKPKPAIRAAAPIRTPQPSALWNATNQSGSAQTAAAASAPRLEPAPMPNQELFAPTERANEDPQVRPTVFRPSTQFRGDGVLPGSSAQSYEERHMMPAAGLNLNVPLK